jgi:aldehyde:ferredoxin oxidoreductase
MDYYRTRKLSPEDLEKLLDDYYDERGWDPKTSWPTQKKIKVLGLDSL